MPNSFVKSQLYQFHMGDFSSFRYISKQHPLLFLSWEWQSKASHWHYVLIFSLFLLPADIVSKNPWEEITGKKKSDFSLPIIPDRLWWIITIISSIKICISGAELPLLTDSKQKGWCLWVEKYLKEGQHSTCGSAAVPCAVVLGLDVKVVPLGTMTEDSAAFYFLILCNDTFSWLALQGSFVLQNSQRACTSCLSTFGVWRVREGNMCRHSGHTCRSSFFAAVASQGKWPWSSNEPVWTALKRYCWSVMKMQQRVREEQGDVKNWTYGKAEVFQLIEMLNQVTSSLKMRTHPGWEQNKLVLITALFLSLFRHSSLASIVPVRVVSLPGETGLFFGSCFHYLAGFIRSRDAITELQ